MNDHGQLQLGGQVELRAKDPGLHGLAGGQLSGVSVFGLGQAKVIEPCFAEGHHPGMCGERAQFVQPGVAGFVGAIGMHAGHREDLRMLLRHRDRATAAIDAGTDADEAVDSRCARPLQDGRQVFGELGKIEVAMRIGKHVEKRKGSIMHKRRGEGTRETYGREK